MSIDLPIRLPFSVDTWGSSSSNKEFHFLTHCHSDHTGGLKHHKKRPIYCSELSQRLLLRRYSEFKASDFAVLLIGQPLLLGAGKENSFTVTAYNANHCPGAIMLLFDGVWGSILHTGDCRLTAHCLSQLPKRIKGGGGGQALDCLYLDQTCANTSVTFPSKQVAITQVLQVIWNHPAHATVYLAVDVLGAEDLLQEVCNVFGTRIYVPAESVPDFRGDLEVVLPQILEPDPSKTRFHVCEGFPKLYERARARFAEAELRGCPPPLFLRPSAQWFTHRSREQNAAAPCGPVLAPTLKSLPKPQRAQSAMIPSGPVRAQRDEFGVWHVCFSTHSSCAELQAAIDKLQPQQVRANTKACSIVRTTSLLKLPPVSGKASVLWGPPCPASPPISRGLECTGGKENLMQEAARAYYSDRAAAGLDLCKAPAMDDVGRAAMVRRDALQLQHIGKNCHVTLVTAGRSSTRPSVMSASSSAPLASETPGNLISGRCFRSLRPPLPLSPPMKLHKAERCPVSQVDLITSLAATEVARSWTKMEIVSIEKCSMYRDIQGRRDVQASHEVVEQVVPRLQNLPECTDGPDASDGSHVSETPRNLDCSRPVPEQRVPQRQASSEDHCISRRSDSNLASPSSATNVEESVQDRSSGHSCKPNTIQRSCRATSVIEGIRPKGDALLLYRKHRVALPPPLPSLLPYCRSES